MSSIDKVKNICLSRLRDSGLESDSKYVSRLEGELLDLRNWIKLG